MLRETDHSMRASLPPFEHVRALVVGDLMLDRYWLGDTQRVSPEAPVPVVRVTRIEERAGGAGNVARNLAALGVSVELAGVVGVDEMGERLTQILVDAGVRCHFQHSAAHPTITKLRVISRNQQLLRLDFEERFDPMPALSSQALHEALKRSQVLLLSDYAKGTLADPQPLIQAARAVAMPVLVDPKGSEFDRYRGATLLTPNQAEFEQVAGRCADEAELIGKARAMTARLDLTALLVTRGGQGMLLVPREGDPINLRAQAREVYDVTGAGDTVIAVLAAALGGGESLERAMVLANRAAGLVVGKLGTATVSADELLRADAAAETPPRGVMSESALQAMVEAAQARGERVVFTNGCFDLLHTGHVSYLAAARALGDRLIVAVNSDESVRRLKGTGRPINPLSQRMAVLGALAAVDWVVAFSEETPERLIRLLKPDLLVKGGDYRPEQIAGADFVRAQGGEVRVLDYVEACSTTAMIEKMAARQGAE